MKPSLHLFPRTARLIGGIVIDTILMSIELTFKVKQSRNKMSSIEINHKKVLIYSVYVNDGIGTDWLNIAELAISESYHPIIVNTGKNKISSDNKQITIFNRRNIGRDISSYGMAISLLNLLKIERLIILNDSMIWNETFLRSILLQNNYELNTIYSLTSSEQKKKHLQSYLIIFNPSVIHAATDFEELKTYRFKRLIVKKGEIGLSENWTKKDIKLRALFDYEYLMLKSLEGNSLSPSEKNQIIKLTNKGIKLNPSIHFWEGLYLDTRSVKKSIVNSNPARMENSPKSLAEAHRIAIGSCPDKKDWQN